MAQSFFHNSVFFSAALILLRFYGLSAAHAGVLFLPLALTNFIGPILLGQLVDTVSRRVMIAVTSVLAGLSLLVSNLLFLHAHPGVPTIDNVDDRIDLGDEARYIWAKELRCEGPTKNSLCTACLP